MVWVAYRDPKREPNLRTREEPLPPCPECQVEAIESQQASMWFTNENCGFKYNGLWSIWCVCWGGEWEVAKMKDTNNTQPISGAMQGMNTEIGRRPLLDVICKPKWGLSLDSQLKNPFQPGNSTVPLLMHKLSTMWWNMSKCLKFIRIWGRAICRKYYR